MLKIIQARLQQYVNREFPNVQAGFRKGRGTGDQITSIRWIIENQENSRKTCFCFIDYAKAFDCVDHNLGPLREEGREVWERTQRSEIWGRWGDSGLNHA